MNKKIIIYVLGRIMQVFGTLFAAPLLVSLIYNEPIIYPISYLIPGIILIVIGYFVTLNEPENKSFYAKEGFIIVSTTWIFISLIGAIPLVINGDIPSIIDAFFEMASGFTTTGSSIMSTLDYMSHSSIFWRSFAHLIGGMGVLVFALAVLPQIGSETVHIMKAEVPGPQFGKLVSKLSDTARILYILYIVFTIITILGLIVLGMPVYDSFIYGFGAAGTGGFAMNDAGILSYNSPAIEIFLSIAMLVFGVNFNLYFLIVLGHFKKIFKSEELKWYLGIVLGAVLLIATQLVVHGKNILLAFKNSFFAVTSIITTTGFATENFNHWPVFAKTILIMLMFVGGMAGSTAGGLKVSRVAIGIKTASAEYKRMLHPNRAVSVVFEGSYVDQGLLNSVASYFFVYASVFVVGLLLITLDAPDFLTAFSTVATTLNNIGPGLEQVGPTGSFAFYNPLSKLVLTFLMIIGRLELFPILVLLSPKTWTSIS